MARNRIDVLCYEFGYGSLELSLGPQFDLHVLNQRATTYLSQIQRVLRPQQLHIGLVGTNPLSNAPNAGVVATSYYRMIASFLQRYRLPFSYKKSCLFNGFTYSCQTHIDVTSENVLLTVNTFNMLSWLRLLLSANSPLMPDGQNFSGCLCWRDTLWGVSGFARDPLNVGVANCVFPNNNQIISYETSKSLFYVERNSQPLFFNPTPMAYILSGGIVIAWQLRPDGTWTETAIEGRPSDIRFFRSYSDCALTTKGTVEVRGDCSQPFNALMAMPALYLGLSERLEEAHALCCRYLPSTDLRALRNKAKFRRIASCIDTSWSDFCRDLLHIAERGLIERGRGEETFLDPLYRRAADRTNPAIEWIREGVDINSPPFTPYSVACDC